MPNAKTFDATGNDDPRVFGNVELLGTIESMLFRPEQFVDYPLGTVVRMALESRDELERRGFNMARVRKLLMRHRKNPTNRLYCGRCGSTDDPDDGSHACKESEVSGWHQ